MSGDAHGRRTKLAYLDSAIYNKLYNPFFDDDDDDGGGDDDDSENHFGGGRKQQYTAAFEEIRENEAVSVFSNCTVTASRSYDALSSGDGRRVTSRGDNVDNGNVVTVNASSVKQSLSADDVVNVVTPHVADAPPPVADAPPPVTRKLSSRSAKFLRLFARKKSVPDARAADAKPTVGRAADDIVTVKTRKTSEQVVTVTTPTSQDDVVIVTTPMPANDVMTPTLADDVVLVTSPKPPDDVVVVTSPRNGDVTGNRKAETKESMSVSQLYTQSAEEFARKEWKVSALADQTTPQPKNQKKSRNIFMELFRKRRGKKNSETDHAVPEETDQSTAKEKPHISCAKPIRCEFNKNPMESDYDVIYKVLVIGESYVGKTSLINSMRHETYTRNLMPTVGVDFVNQDYDVDGHRVRLQIWDTAGQERFRDINKFMYRGTKGLLLVFDITDKNTFDSINYWMRTLAEADIDSEEVIIVGNKCDLWWQRKIKLAAAEKLAKYHSSKYFETSAKENTNVTELFSQMAYDLVEANNPKLLYAYTMTVQELAKQKQKKERK